MKREFILDKSIIDIQRYLRRINAKLIRLMPKQVDGHDDAYVILYILR